MAKYIVKIPADDYWRCEVCEQVEKIENGGMFPIWHETKLAYTHTNCAQYALINGWNTGHHNIIRESSRHNWLVFWRGECAEVKTHKEAKELLKQLNEGNSTKLGGTD